MGKKMVWQCDSEGYLLAEIELSKKAGDVGKKGKWLIPAGCVEIEPPEMKEGFCLRWIGNEWSYEEAPEEKVDEELKERKIEPLERLNQEFGSEKKQISSAFLTAQLRNDHSLIVELQEELQELEKDYIAKIQWIEAGLDPWSEGGLA